MEKGTLVRVDPNKHKYTPETKGNKYLPSYELKYDVFYRINSIINFSNGWELVSIEGNDNLYSKDIFIDVLKERKEKILKIKNKGL